MPLKAVSASLICSLASVRLPEGQSFTLGRPDLKHTLYR